VVNTTTTTTVVSSAELDNSVWVRLLKEVISGDWWLCFPKDLVFPQNHCQARQSCAFRGMKWTQLFWGYKLLSQIQPSFVCCSLPVEAKHADGDVSSIVKETTNWLQKYFSEGVPCNLPNICVLSDDKIGKQLFSAPEHSIATNLGSGLNLTR